MAKRKTSSKQPQQSNPQPDYNSTNNALNGIYPRMPTEQEKAKDKVALLSNYLPHAKCTAEANYIRKKIQDCRCVANGGSNCGYCGSDIGSVIVNEAPNCNNLANNSTNQGISSQEFQRQQQNQQIGSLMNNMLSNMAEGGQQTANEFSQKMADNRDKVDAINNQSNQNQPKDDKGIMDAARRGNLSTEELGPGQEMDEDDKKLLAEPETKRLIGLSDAQFEAERQRFMERNKDRPNDNPAPNYGGGTSRLAESEREIQRRQAENAPSQVTSGDDQSTAMPDKSDEETIADNMRSFARRIKEKGFNWASLTDEEKAQAAYMGYMAMNVAQSVAGNFLYMYGGGVGALYGFTLNADAVNDAMRIQNPFLNKRSKK